jgi:hypothetical protein
LDGLWRRTGLTKGAREEWLRTGKLPSGYPSEIEAILNPLTELHAASEGTAQKQFPPAFHGDRIAFRQDLTATTPVAAEGAEGCAQAAALCVPDFAA